MLLGCENFGPIGTANLPAAGDWTASSGVTVVQGGGRSGFAGDNCLSLTTVGNQYIRRAVTVTAQDGIYTLSVGVAVRVLSMGTSFTIGSIRTGISVFSLILLDTGRLRITQTTGMVLLGTVCQTAEGVMPVGAGGAYIEFRVRLDADAAAAVQLLVSDQQGAMNPLAQGALLALAAGDSPITELWFGGGVGEDTAVWRITDIYWTDGVPVSTSAVTPSGVLTYNDGFLGNVHVESLFASADGVNLTVGNTPWTPNAGAVHYDRVNEHPPDDATYEYSNTETVTDVYRYVSGLLSSYGRAVRPGCSSPAWPVLGVKWDGRMAVVTDPAIVAPVVRRIVTGTLASDAVSAGPLLTISDTSYLYAPVMFDRDPTRSGAPWTLEMFKTQTNPAAVGAYEFGIQRPSTLVLVGLGSVFLFGGDF